MLFKTNQSGQIRLTYRCNIAILSKFRRGGSKQIDAGSGKDEPSSHPNRKKG